jgi:hypothetical protein
MALKKQGVRTRVEVECELDREGVLCKTPILSEFSALKTRDLPRQARDNQ